MIHNGNGNGCKVAVYWDFENIHWSLNKKLNGESRLEQGRKAELIRLPSIVHKVGSFGQIVMHKAYGNWTRLWFYQKALLNNSVDLIQLFQWGEGPKNGADIRMSLDVMEDLNRLPHITHVVVFTGDSDFVPLAQKIRQTGRLVIGSGVSGSINKGWRHACNEFIDYETVSAEISQQPLDPLKQIQCVSTLDQAKELVVRAMKSLGELTHDGWACCAAVGTWLLRVDSTFRPANYNCRSLSALLRRLPDVVELKSSETGLMVRLVMP